MNFNSVLSALAGGSLSLGFGLAYHDSIAGLCIAIGLVSIGIMVNTYDRGIQ